MKITKLVHSCLLVEGNDKTALIDPGAFSWQSVLVDLAKIARLDYLIITHNHPDHLHEPFVQAVKQRFPDVRLAANAEISQQLQNMGMLAADDACIGFEAAHEPVPSGGEVPINWGWHFDRLTHPGDSFGFTETREVLALPYVAPWGSTTAAVELAKRLKPKYVVPVHDWHLSDEARKRYAGLLVAALQPAGINVISTENGTIEI
ncbi:MAG TPA: MBL fold metallo-hydrolase [Candidatus Saccharimonadales bacterium]